MKNSRGFTLIELVIVIVILGILGAVAAPRFINMQGDAYEANVKALNGSIQSAMTLANTKAVLNGYDKESITVLTADFEKPATAITAKDDGTTVTFINGFPVATKQGIIAMLQDVDTFSTGDDSTYKITEGTADTPLIIAPTARGISSAADDTKCQVEYTQAVDKNTPATVKAFTKGC